MALNDLADSFCHSQENAVLKGLIYPGIGLALALAGREVLH